MASCEVCSCSKGVEKEKIINFDCLAPEIQKLLKQASDVRQKAYCPYSKFKVGASVLCENGKTYTGCNVENVSFTVGICAERNAYSTAISEGNKKFKAVAVVARQEDDFTTPCGACRQFLREFGDVDVYCANPDMEKVFVTNVQGLLPYAFTSL
ncbi:cytidine deaminase-like [Onthophagus taurus]|uniref:cytidine deaminase-like n=1 Tax=Onthophagus taurus TaxID=166361 RepID=UPI000C20250C|nr:cytidine deaminase-like [Onthophagus taurus]